MKRFYLRSAIGLGLMAVLSMIVAPPLTLSYTVGSPPGSTGAPGDIATCIQCHGAQVTNKPGWITSNIPPGGFAYGTTYTINLIATHAGAAKIGFEACVVGPGPQKVGTVMVTEPLRSQIVGTHYITHTSGGLTPENDSNSWSFNWIAPSSGALYATIYACFNGANGDGLASGDRLYTSQLSVFHESTAGINHYSGIENLVLYPNPASGLIFLNNAGPESNTYTLYDFSGKPVLRGYVDAYQPIDISMLPGGLFLLSLQSSQGTRNFKVIKE